MMVLGFIVALLLGWRICRRQSGNPEILSNIGIVALLSGVVGARLMHVLHNWSTYRNNLGEVFAIWSGGLEFLGGVAAALGVILIYFKLKIHHTQNLSDADSPRLAPESSIFWMKLSIIFKLLRT